MNQGKEPAPPKPVKVLLKDGSTHSINVWCKNGDLIDDRGHVILVNEIDKILLWGCSQ